MTSWRALVDCVGRGLRRRRARCRSPRLECPGTELCRLLAVARVRRRAEARRPRPVGGPRGRAGRRQHRDRRRARVGAPRRLARDARVSAHPRADARLRPSRSTRPRRGRCRVRMARGARWNYSARARVEGVLFDRLHLGEPDANGRNALEPTGERFMLIADAVVAAVGQSTQSQELLPRLGLLAREFGIGIDASGRTSRRLCLCGR